METIIKKHKSHRYCSVPHCKSTCSREISLFLLPKSKDLAKQWADILDIRKQATKYIYVCSLHFDKKDFTLSMSAKKRRLKNGAVPSKNLPIIKATSSGVHAPKLLDSEDNKLVEEQNCERAPFKKMLKDEANNSASLAECRACLQLCTNEEQHNLFQCWDPPWPGMENTLAEDLSKLACVQISQSDTHSKILCQSCYKHLQNACQFVEIVKKADEVLNLRLGNNPDTPDSWPKPIQIDKNVPYDKVQIKDEILSDEETLQINADDFSNVDVKIEADDWPSQTVHINGIISLGQLNKEMAEINGYIPEVEQNGTTKGLTHEKPITNGVVNYKHDKADSFTNCLNITIKDEPVSDAESESNADDLSLNCILCSKTFLSLTGLKAHVIAQHSYKMVRRKALDDTEDKLLNYICNICHRRFETPTDLMVHVTCHNKCVCYGCNTNFETFNQLSQHRRNCQNLKNNEVGKVLKLEDVQRMANIAQRILEVITKFTIFAPDSEQGNIDECYHALLAVITQKEDSICDDLSDDDDNVYNLLDLESVDDILLEYNKNFLSDLDIQNKSSTVIESSFMEQDHAVQTDYGFCPVEHSFKPITKLSYPVVKITRLESPILQNLKSNYLDDNHSDTSSTYEDFEELDESEFLLDSEDLLDLCIDKQDDSLPTKISEKQIAKEDDNQLRLSNSKFSTTNSEYIDTSRDLLLHTDFNNINEKSYSAVFLQLSASNSITEDDNIVNLEFDDSNDEFHSDDVSVCLKSLSKYFPENDVNFGKSSSDPSSEFLESYLISKIANTNMEPDNNETINILDQSNDNLKKSCKINSIEPISVNINTSFSQVLKNNNTDIVSNALALCNINCVTENVSVKNANLNITPCGMTSDNIQNPNKETAVPTCELENNNINGHCLSIVPVSSKQTKNAKTNLRSSYKIHNNLGYSTSPICVNKTDKCSIEDNINSMSSNNNTSCVIESNMKNSEHNSKVQSDGLPINIIFDWEKDVIDSDLSNAKEASPRECPIDSQFDLQTFEPLNLPRLVGVHNKFIFRYRKTQKIRPGCKNDCRFSCNKIFTSNQRLNIFNDFWKMDLSAQSEFLDEHVVKNISRNLLSRHTFILPVSNQSVRVCRKFIEDTFSLSMLAFRKELRRYNMTFDDYYSKVGKKYTKVLHSSKKQTMSKNEPCIQKFKENENTVKQPLQKYGTKKDSHHPVINSGKVLDTRTTGIRDTKSDNCFINETKDIIQRNYVAEKCCTSSNKRDININVSNGDMVLKININQTGSETNKNMSDRKFKNSENNKQKDIPEFCNNKYVSDAKKVTKRHKFNNMTEKVSFSRSNPYVKLIDVGFYTQLHTLNFSETLSNDSAINDRQLEQNLDISNSSIFRNVSCHSNEPDKSNLSSSFDIDLQISIEDSNSKSILETEIKTNLLHSFFEDLQTSNEDSNSQSILQGEIITNLPFPSNPQILKEDYTHKCTQDKPQMAHPSNIDQQISNKDTNWQSLLQDEVKPKVLYSFTEDVAWNEDSNTQRILQEDIENNQFFSNNLTSEITNDCRDKIKDHLPCLSAEDLQMPYEKSNMHNDNGKNLPLSINPQMNTENSSIIQDKIEENLSHLSTEVLQTSYDDSSNEINMQVKVGNNLAHLINSQTNNEYSSSHNIKNHSPHLSTNKSQISCVESNLQDHNGGDLQLLINHLPTKELPTSNEGSNIQYEIENNLHLSIYANQQCTSEDSRCNDIQKQFLQLSSADFQTSNEENNDRISMEGEIQHNEDSSCRNINEYKINNHLPHISNEVLQTSNEESNDRIGMTDKIQHNEDSSCHSINECKVKNHLHSISNEVMQTSNEESNDRIGMTDKIQHNEDSSCHSINKCKVKNHLHSISNEVLQTSNEESNDRISMADKIQYNEDSSCHSINEGKVKNNLHSISNEVLQTSNEESNDRIGRTDKIQCNEDSSIRQDEIENHLPYVSNEDLQTSNDESNGQSNLQDEIKNNLPLSFNLNLPIYSEDALCHNLYDTQISYKDKQIILQHKRPDQSNKGTYMSNTLGQSVLKNSIENYIIQPLNDPQNYTEESTKSIQEGKTTDNLSLPFHADTQISENDPRIPQDINEYNTAQTANTDLKIAYEDSIQQKNLNESTLSIANMMTYNKDSGQNNIPSNTSLLESQIAIGKINSIQMSSKFISILENKQEIFKNTELCLLCPESHSPKGAAHINLEKCHGKKTNHCKLQRIIGKGYKFMFRYKVTRSLMPGCHNCTYKCTQNIGLDQRRIIFENFWKMDIHAQTNYLNSNVFLINPILGLRDVNETRMKRNHKFFLPVYGKRFRVCKKFFLSTLSILMTDFKNNSSHLKIMHQRLNPHVKLNDIGFHKEPQPAIEINVSSVSKTPSLSTNEYIKTLVSNSWNDSLDNQSNLDLYSPQTNIALTNELLIPPDYVRLTATNVDAFQNNSSSEPQSPIYGQLSTVDQHHDSLIITNICPSNVDTSDKNTQLMKPRERNSIDSFITNILDVKLPSNEEQSFKAILKDWAEPQETLDKYSTKNYNQYLTSINKLNIPCTVIDNTQKYVETKSYCFIEMEDKLGYESSLDCASISNLDFHRMPVAPYFPDSDNNINTVSFDSSFDTQPHKRSTEVFSKDFQIQNAEALSNLSNVSNLEDAERNPCVESQTLEIQEDDQVTTSELLSRGQPFCSDSCAVDELSKNIDSILIATKPCVNSTEHAEKDNVSNSEWQYKERQERAEIISTSTATPTLTDSINNGHTEQTKAVDKSVLYEINIDQNTSVININEGKSLDITDKPDTNVIQDNNVTEILHSNQKSDTSAIDMESVKYFSPNSSLSINNTNQNNQSPSNKDSLATQTETTKDAVASPNQGINNNLSYISHSYDAVTLLPDLNVQKNQSYHSITGDSCSSRRETSFTYTDLNSIETDPQLVNYSFNSSSVVMEPNALQLIDDRRRASNYAQMSDVFAKDTYYETESSCSQFAYDSRSTIDFSKSSLDFYPSFDSQPDVVENVESDVAESFKSILNDWAS